ncbi:Ms4533A family Cys-rich leader peptide [Actinacidiphila yanglinensis]|nr:Ms4533A family Cys-rich leader peptide [Actinacidiphila yanglinensis]
MLRLTRLFEHAGIELALIGVAAHSVADVHCR